ncbi:MFS transporter [Clostridium sp. CF012]|uniref:MFS transporter n=1 Tax=Clostridium sp. CF012 TaxID=2843319 RepID=UPI001C0E3F16|nr:MFS transporter [Clostridium sp. CF012]MBU3146093.1 MFS transporter [Clostridium sp. CF012]
MVSKAVSGIIYDRIGHKVIMYPAAVCGMIGLYLLSIVNGTLLLLVAAVFYGAAYGFLTPTLQTITVSKVSKKKQGIANAIYSVSIFFIVVLVVLYAFTLGREKTVN